LKLLRSVASSSYVQITKDEDEARVRVDAILYKLFDREPTQAEIKQTLQEVKNYSRGEIGEDEDDYYW